MSITLDWRKLSMFWQRRSWPGECDGVKCLFGYLNFFASRHIFIWLQMVLIFSCARIIQWNARRESLVKWLPLNFVHVNVEEGGWISVWLLDLCVTLSDPLCANAGSYISYPCHICLSVVSAPRVIYQQRTNFGLNESFTTNSLSTYDT